MLKKTSFFFVVVSLAAPALAGGSNHVRGYVRSDGTYVAPHYRTNPDSSRYNNWSSTPNVNPYTGRSGTVNPYATPSYGSSPLKSSRPSWDLSTDPE